MKVEESLNVTFDETSSPPKISPLEDDDLVKKEAIEVSKTRLLGNDLKDKSLENNEIMNIKESKSHPLENVIVHNPKNMTIIGTKWVYRNKLDENGVVSRNKARYREYDLAPLKLVFEFSIYNVWKSVQYGVSNGLDTAYWGFLGVGTTFDIFQNIILIPYLEYGVLSPLDTAY
ncbi:hypothetical protein Tco_0153895 [Tanacetum coccineum]